MYLSATWLTILEIQIFTAWVACLLIYRECVSIKCFCLLLFQFSLVMLSLWFWIHIPFLHVYFWDASFMFNCTLSLRNVQPPCLSFNIQLQTEPCDTCCASLPSTNGISSKWCGRAVTHCTTIVSPEMTWMLSFCCYVLQYVI